MWSGAASNEKFSTHDVGFVLPSAPAVEVLYPLLGTALWAALTVWTGVDATFLWSMQFAVMFAFVGLVGYTLGQVERSSMPNPVVQPTLTHWALRFARSSYHAWFEAKRKGD